MRNILIILFKCVNFFGVALSYFFSSGIIRFISRAKNEFYTGWKSRNFKSLGNNARIDYPLYLNGGKYISIGRDFLTLSRLRIDVFDSFYSQKFTPNLIIGNNVALNFDCHIACINRITIGNNVLIASRVFITDHLHGDSFNMDIIPILRPLTTKGAVIIEDDVLIGENVSIMPGVRIGKGAIIGANAVVTKDCDPFSVYGGIPAKKINVK